MLVPGLGPKLDKNSCILLSLKLSITATEVLLILINFSANVKFLLRDLFGVWLGILTPEKHKIKFNISTGAFVQKF